MKLTSRHTPVLIVGAGPSGLMMAAQLIRFGVQPLIIDSKKGPTDKSKALAVQARSMEIYSQLGIIDEVLKEGKASQGLKFFYGPEQFGTFPISDSGKGLTPYPYLFMYLQSNNERVLLTYLTNHALPVFWETSLVSFEQTPQKVVALVDNGEDRVEITADWIIGADGAHSMVRKQLNIPFMGETYQHLFYLADVVSDKDEDFVSLYLSDKSFAGFFPIPGSNGYRIIGKLPEELKSKPDVQLEDVLPYLQKIKGAPTLIKELRWFTIYKLSHRMAERFNDGKGFLIGDAAHIHSPVGGQGMNTGLQDAYNLGWKLAYVIRGRMHPTILKTYAGERLPVAKTLLKTTDRMFNVIMSDTVLARGFKKYVLPGLLKLLWSSKVFTTALFKRISQIGISYMHSNINLHLSQSTTIKAGDRLPCYKIFDEKKKEETSLHNWCVKPGFTLIIFGTMAEQELHQYAKWISRNYNDVLNFYYLPYSQKNAEVFDAFEVKKGQWKAVIVRPDNYIGFIADSVDLGIINNYLLNTTFLKAGTGNVI